MPDKLFSSFAMKIANIVASNAVNAIYFDVIPTHIAAQAKGFSHPNAMQTAWIFLTSHLAFDIKTLMEYYSHSEIGGCAGFAVKYMARNSFQVDHDGFSPLTQGVLGCANGYGYATGRNFIINNAAQEQNSFAYEYMIPISIESSETIARLALSSGVNNFYEDTLKIFFAGLKGAITPFFVTTYTKLTYDYAQQTAHNITHTFTDFIFET